MWFKKWIQHGNTISHLCSISGHSSRKMRYIIDYWLGQVPGANNQRIARCRYSIFDGTFLDRPDSVVVIMDAQDRSVIASSYPVRETSVKQLRTFLGGLKEDGLSLVSVTLDGNPQAIMTFRQLWPGITIQRCLVHIQRQGLMWCRAKPQTELAKQLRELFVRTTYIRTPGQRDNFVRDLNRWENKYGEEVENFPSGHKTLSDLRRARSMIIKALPDMFHYLDNSNIPFSTNSLEGYYSRLKWAYRNHRGMAIHKRINYFKWYTILKQI